MFVQEAILRLPPELIDFETTYRPFKKQTATPSLGGCRKGWAECNYPQGMLGSPTF